MPPFKNAIRSIYVDDIYYDSTIVSIFANSECAYVLPLPEFFNADKKRIKITHIWKV